MIILRNLRLERIFLLLAGILFIVGCVPERKLGSEYLSKRHDITLVIRVPEWVKMVNLSADSIKDRVDMTQRDKDSVKFYTSKILQNVTDSILIDNYIKGMKISLENQGYKTKIASRYDSVFPVNGNAFLINIGQIELDEQKVPYRDEVKYNGKLYGADYDLTKIELCFWVEVSKIENGISVQPPRLLYDSFEDTDNVEGHFSWDNKANQMNYILTTEEITPALVDTTVSLIGNDHALRLDEFLMNEYIANFLPQKQNRLLYGVNRKFGTLLRIYEPPFKEIQE